MRSAHLMSRAAGRGTQTNAFSERFNLAGLEPDGDWLDQRDEIDSFPPPQRTTVTVERPKSIITTNRSPDIPFDQSINPYRGCEHGCIYCYARPSHAYHDLSPGLDFESRLFAKPDAKEILKSELARKGYSPRPIALGTNTDPYQPIEREWGITRSIIELLGETGHPMTITTKSDRILRDLDVLAPMAKRGLVAVAVSVTSLDPGLHRILEPRAPRPERRLRAIGALAAAGVPTHVNVAPVIPAINDHEVESILQRAAENGAITASFIPLRLPHEVAALFREWLEVHFPDRAGKVMSQVQGMRSGKDNDPAFFSRMRGSGPWASLMRERFRLACRKLGLNEQRVTLRKDLFKPPDGRQLSLF